MNSRDTRPILERLAFVIYLALFVASGALTGLGLIFAVLVGNPQPLLIGCGGSVLTAMIREVGYRQWHFKQWEASLDQMHLGARKAPGSRRAAHASELGRLLEQLDALGARTLAEGRDVWKVQRLRQRARLLLAREPELRTEFSRELARHPELV